VTNTFYKIHCIVHCLYIFTSARTSTTIKGPYWNQLCLSPLLNSVWLVPRHASFERSQKTEQAVPLESDPGPLKSVASNSPISPCYWQQLQY